MRPWLFICVGMFACSLAVGVNDAFSQDTETVSSEAQAGPGTSSDGALPAIIPFFGQGVADDAEVHDLVGTPTYSLDGGCSQDHHDYDGYDDNRSVKATLERLSPDFEQHGNVIDAILKGAAVFAWQTCPHAFFVLDQPTNYFHYNLKRVSIFGPNGELVATAQLGGNGGFFNETGDQPLRGGRNGYFWSGYHNALEERRTQNAQAQQQQAIAEQQQQQQAADQEQARKNDASFWMWIWLFAVGAVLVWLFTQRELIARWFYSLQPHPAAHIVDRAVYADAPIDGDIYERVLRPVPGGPIEKGVRADQARDLTGRLREHEAALRSEEVRAVEAERRRVEQENAFRRAHAELLKAGVDHEIAAARVDELRKAARQ